jgi:hypothetical protein
MLFLHLFNIVEGFHLTKFDVDNFIPHHLVLHFLELVEDCLPLLAAVAAPGAN